VLGHRFAFQAYLRDTDAVLALGGDNYSLDYGIPKAFFDANRSVLAARKPLIIWGASIGPFTAEPAFESYATEELKRVNLICSRESRTIDYLDSLGIRDSVCKVVDPAFLLDPQEPTLTGDEQKILETPHIGVNLSPLLARYRGDVLPWPEQAAELVHDILRVQRYPIALIPHVMQPNNSDYDFLKDIYTRLREEQHRMILIGPDHSSRAYKWIISRCRVFLGARTHATIASLSSCVPTLSLSYSAKSVGINQDVFGDQSWVVPLSELEPGRLSTRLNHLLAQERQVRHHLSTVMPEYSQRARAGLSRIAAIMQASA
jgi:colanic acid/amylovoran biosynthesis protein